jgi:hypothetical protein
VTSRSGSLDWNFMSVAYHIERFNWGKFLFIKKAVR